MRNCGQREKYRHELTPFNHRLDTIQAAALRVKLRYLDHWNEARRNKADLYNELLSNSEIRTPVGDNNAKHIYHLYVIRTSYRDALQAYLQDQGIGTGIHYPKPIHLQPYYASSHFYHGQFPMAEKLCNEILSLPMFPTISTEQVQHVTKCVVEFYKSVPVMESDFSTVL